MSVEEPEDRSSGACGAIAHPEPSQLTLDGLLDALADPQRRALYRQIEAAPGIVCSNLGPGLPRSTVSVQLRRLREAGLIQQAKKGQLIVNELRPDGARARFPDILGAIDAADTLHAGAGGPGKDG